MASKTRPFNFTQLSSICHEPYARRWAHRVIHWHKFEKRRLETASSTPFVAQSCGTGRLHFREHEVENRHLRPCNGSYRGGLRPEFAPLLHDLCVELRHLEDADREHKRADPLHGVEEDAMRGVGKPAPAIPHPRIRIPGVADVNEHDRERKREAQWQAAPR